MEPKKNQEEKSARYKHSSDRSVKEDEKRKERNHKTEGQEMGSEKYKRDSGKFKQD